MLPSEGIMHVLQNSVSGIWWVSTYKSNCTSGGLFLGKKVKLWTNIFVRIWCYSHSSAMKSVSPALAAYYVNSWRILASSMNGVCGHSHSHTSTNLRGWRSLSDDSPITPLEFFLEPNFLKIFMVFLWTKILKFISPQNFLNKTSQEWYQLLIGIHKGHSKHSNYLEV